MFGDLSLPDCVPSFLAALPENIRQEVIAEEQLRLQRIQERAQEQQQQAAQLGVSEVSAEFLAALPPSIQEEVRMLIDQLITITAGNNLQPVCIRSCVPNAEI